MKESFKSDGNCFPKKLIESWFPIEIVGEEGRKQKSAGSSRISVIHQWHARRPISAMRAIVVESLLEIPESQVELEEYGYGS